MAFFLSCPFCMTLSRSHSGGRRTDPGRCWVWMVGSLVKAAGRQLPAATAGGSALAAKAALPWPFPGWFSSSNWCVGGSAGLMGTTQNNREFPIPELTPNPRAVQAPSASPAAASLPQGLAARPIRSSGWTREVVIRIQDGPRGRTLGGFRDPIKCIP